MNFEASGKFAEIFTSEKKERKKERKKEKRRENMNIREPLFCVLSPCQKHTLESIFKNREICQVYAVITDMFTWQTEKEQN